MTAIRETSLEDLRLDYRVEVDGLTGAASVAVPIRASEGREHFGPQLALYYASGGGPSPFGFGWTLAGLHTVAVDLREGVPAFRGGADRYVHQGGDELVPFLRQQPIEWQPVAEERGAFRVERWRSRIERAYQRFERWVDKATGRAHWVRRDPDGTVSIFGRSPDDSTRIADPVDPAHRTWQWLLEAQYHPGGSAIRYVYKAEDAAGVDASRSFEGERVRGGGPFPQRYLKRILYGNTKPLSLERPDDAANAWRFELVLDYGEHTAGAVPSFAEVRPWPARLDPTSTHRAGFEVRTWRLCRRLLMFHRFPELGADPCLVGETGLRYSEEPAGAVLQGIAFRGWRKELPGGQMASRDLPPLAFAYSGGGPAAAFEPAATGENLPVGLDGGSFRWVDLLGEGLPGFLAAQDGAWYFKESLGDGRFGPLQHVDELPCAPSAFQLQDFDGDGNLDLVGFEGREAGHFVRDRNTGRWQLFRSFRDLPRVDFANARLEWVDLDGDGRPELVVDHGDRLSWYRSEGADGFAPAVEIARPDRRAGGGAAVAQDAAQHTFFADMDGDGLADLVRIDSGRVEYWPNLGNGRFGPPVTMEGAPDLSAGGDLDARRLRLVDLDGSGTTDLLWIGDGTIRCWINQGGNRFGPEQSVPGLPTIDQMSRADVLDFLGDGTSCLVWSTPVLHEQRALQFLRLNGPVPPRLLTSVSDGMGRTTSLSYQSSARDHLRDKRAGRPWTRLLPHHPIVVARLEAADGIGGGRLVTRYEYRDGCFDAEERRMIGFARVDALDADEIAAPGVPPEEVTPPSRVQRFHLSGDPDGGTGVAAGIWARDPLHARLPAPALEDVAGMTTAEQLDAFRALAGSPWREEVFAVRPDRTLALHPIRTAETAYVVRRLQPAVVGRRAAFAAYTSETVHQEYEEDPTDPRVQHGLVLAVGPYGDVDRQVSIAYSRRPVGPEVRPEQQALLAVVSDSSYAQVDEPGRYETGIELSERRHALYGIAPPAAGLLQRTALGAKVDAALAQPLGLLDPPGAGPQSKLVHLERTRYWDEARASALPAGGVGPVTLVHHVERGFLAEADVAAAFDGRVTPALLSGDGRYVRADGFWWAEEETRRYRNADGFYLLEQQIGVAGGRQTTTWDPHSMFAIAAEDAFANRVESAIDYQALAAWRVTDPNGNVTEVRYDPLGAVAAGVVRGQQLGRDGAVHPVGDAPLTGWVLPAGLTRADMLADPAGVLQGATRVHFQDLFSFARGDGPPLAIDVERESHGNDGEGNVPPTAIRVELQYLDGFGRTVQRKVRAGPGPAIQRDAAGNVVLDAGGAPVQGTVQSRWLASGHDVFDNKGWRVRAHQPFFTATAAFESDASLRALGAATRTRFDPTGRAVREDAADGSFTSRTFAAWSTREFDANDNVIGSAWEAARAALPAGDPARDALLQAQAHAFTPMVVELDPLGRSCRRRELGEGGVVRQTVVTFGPLGSPEKVVDPRGVVAFTYRHDLLGRPVLESSADAGARTTLNDAADHPVHRWDARGVHVAYRYDGGGRLVETAVEEPAAARRVVERVAYADDPVVAQAQLRNARGRVVRHDDEAGTVSIARYHLHGEPQEVARALLADHRLVPDWSGAAAPAVSPELRVVLDLDGQGRVTRRELPDGTVREYQYAPLGHLAEVRLTTADGRLNRSLIASGIEHDPRGQRARLVLGNGVGISWGYDAKTFRLKQLRVASQAGAPREYMNVSYTYDPTGNVTQLVDAAQDPGAPAPQLQGLTVSPACDYAYDAFYQLRSATGRVHQALLPQDAWSPDRGNVVAGTRHLRLDNGAAVERYARRYDYDLSGNLQRVRHQGTTRSWTTDIWTSPVSNRSLPGADLAGNPLADPESWFDRNGNTVRLPHLRALRWDHANRLIGTTLIDRSDRGEPDDAEWYAWGGDGRRVRRVTERRVAGGTEIAETVWFDQCEIRRIVRQGSTRLLRFTSHVLDGDTRIATLHQWRIDQSRAETNDPAQKRLRYMVGNHLGSIALELDEAAGIVSYEEYFPYGGTSFAAGPAARDVALRSCRFAGQLRDDATGLYHFEFREYLPWIGHWLSPDPAGPVDGPNLFAYVHGNPIRFVDAEGLQSSEPQVTTSITNTIPPEIQRMFDRDPGLRARFDRQQVYFRVDETGHWIQMSRAEARAWVREQNRAHRIPGVNLYRPPARHVRHHEAVREPDRPVPFPTEVRDQGPGAADSGSRGGTSTGGGTGTGGATGTTGGTGPAAGTGDQNGDGDSGHGTAHPADGSSGSGNTGNGQTGESGSNGSATTGVDPGAGNQGQGKGGGDAQGNTAAGDPGTGGRGPGGSGSADASGAGRGQTGSRTDATGGVPGGVEGGVDTGAEGGQSGGVPGVPPAPAGYEVGPDGIPYTPDLPPPPADPGAGGTTTTDPNLATHGDGRGDPGTDRNANTRPPGAGSGRREGDPAGTRERGTGTPAGSARGEARDGRRDGTGQGPGETSWERVVRWAGYLNLVFDQGEGGERGGIPGGLGLLGLKGTFIQVLFVVSTIISTILTVQAIIKSVSMAALRQGLSRLLFALRNPGAALRGLFTAARGFGGEAMAALRAFRAGRTPWYRWITRLIRDPRSWKATIQSWRDGSFWFKPRWFGLGPHYNWEHIVTQNFGRTFPRLQPFVNGVANTFLRLPMRFNSALGNRIGPKLLFYMGALEANIRSWRFGHWLGDQAAQEIYREPEPSAPRGVQH